MVLDHAKVSTTMQGYCVRLSGCFYMVARVLPMVNGCCHVVD